MSTLITTLDPPACGSSPHPAYAQITTIPLGSARLITISGQVADDPETGSVPEDLGDQVDVCFGKIRACLEACGATVHDLVKVMYYVVGFEPSMLSTVTDRIVGFMEGHRPAGCLLGIQSSIDGRFKVEIEATAVVKEEK
ncbi:hypothetical protein MMC10_005023 [Thelotrema lepadinum]|nr:hypothetical protein [Thelotrema lepadinum]